MDDRSLEIGVYEHFKDYFNTRGVGIITDKQFVLYTQYSLEDGFNHDTAMPYLDKKIYPFKHYEGFYQNSKDITFASALEDIYFFMPDSETISKAQQQFLYYVVDEIDRYNNEAYDRKKIKINILAKTNSNSITTVNGNEAKKVIEKFIIRDNIVEQEENILGKTLNDINAYSKILDKSQIEMLSELGVSTDNIPKSLLTEFEKFKLSSLENDYLRAIKVDELNAETLDFEKVCIKNIVGTQHPDYRNKSLIDSYAALKRGNDIIEKQKQNPDYYTTTLKDKNRKIYDEITLVERNGKYYITQGNNRLITQLVSYLAEREKILGNDQAISELDEKYTFYLKSAKLPREKEEMILITLIKKFDNDIIIKRNSDTEGLYTIIIGEQEYHLKDIDEIRNFVDNLFDNHKLKTGKEIEDILAIFILEYYGNYDFKNFIQDMDVTQKFLKLRDLRYNKSIAYDKLLETMEDGISYGTLLETLKQKESDLFIRYVEKIKEVKNSDDFAALIQEISESKLFGEEKEKIASLISEKNAEMNQKIDPLEQQTTDLIDDNSDINQITNAVDQLANVDEEREVVEKKSREEVEHDLLMKRYKELMGQGYRPDHAERIARLVVREEMKTYDKVEQIKETMQHALLEEKKEEAVQVSFIIDKEDRNLCKYKLEKVDQNQRILMDSFDFKYDEKSQTNIMEPIITNYAECSPTMGVNIENGTDNSKLDTSNLVIVSENNNVLNIENIETVHANNISMAIQHITPTLFEQQQEQKKVNGQQNEGTVLSRKLGTENGNHGYINLFILTVVVSVVCLAFIFLGILILE